MNDILILDICPNCNLENENNYEVCSNCEQVLRVKTCDNCHNYIQFDENSCPLCDFKENVTNNREYPVLESVNPYEDMTLSSELSNSIEYLSIGAIFGTNNITTSLIQDSLKKPKKIIRKAISIIFNKIIETLKKN